MFKCDDPMCPVILGETGHDCRPSGNTFESQVWCEHIWVPWANAHLASLGVPMTTACNKDNGFLLAKLIGAYELVAYAMLWIMPRLGAAMLVCCMVAILELHVGHLGDDPAKLTLQLVLLAAAFMVMAVPGRAQAPRDKKRN